MERAWGYRTSAVHSGLTFFWVLLDCDILIGTFSLRFFPFRTFLGDEVGKVWGCPVHPTSAVYLGLTSTRLVRVEL